MAYHNPERLARHKEFVMAIASNKIEKVRQFLFEGDLEIDYYDQRIGSPIVHAMYSRSIEMFDLIIQAGAIVNLQTHYAGKYGSDIINTWYSPESVPVQFREHVRQEILRQSNVLRKEKASE